MTVVEPVENDTEMSFSEFPDHFKCSSCSSECGFNFVSGMEEDIGLHIQNDQPGGEQVSQFHLCPHCEGTILSNVGVPP